MDGDEEVNRSIYIRGYSSPEIDVIGTIGTVPSDINSYMSLLRMDTTTTNGTPAADGVFLYTDN